MLKTRIFRNFARNSFGFSEKSWIYGQKSQLYNVELANILKSLEKSDPEFLLVDVRENEELFLADIPQRNEKGIYIPKVHIPLEKIFKIDVEPLYELKKNKYLICYCHLGIRSGKACFHLRNRDYKAINLYGGIKELAKVYEGIPQY